MAAITLTLARLRELLSFDPLTGQFTRLTTTGRCDRYKAGSRAGGVDVHGYGTVFVDGYQHKAHRLAWFYMTGEWPARHVDHKNGNRTDNRFENLRQSDDLLNMQNLRAAKRSSRSGLLGAYPNRKGWMAQIRAGGKHLHLGTFDTPEEAHAVYIEAKRRLHPGCTI